MKILKLLIIILLGFNAIAQDYKEIHMSEVDIAIDVVKPSIEILSILNEPLHGNYKINDYKKNEYKLATLIDGRIHGILKQYENDTLVGITPYLEGLKNGESVAYDKSGTIWSRTNWKNGRKHGILWDAAYGEQYYLKGTRVTKNQFETYFKYN